MVVVYIKTELICHSYNTMVDKGYNLAFLISCKAMDFSNIFQDRGAAFLNVKVRQENGKWRTKFGFAKSVFGARG